MSITCKSPLGVAREALVVGSAAFPEYSHRYSPKVYTQPQLFACLVLKTFFNTDYRGICRMLEDLTDLPALLGLAKVPHFSTLHKASKRLLSAPDIQRMLDVTVGRLKKQRRRVKLAAIDSTGFQCGHASSYYTRRRTKDGKKAVLYKHYAKLEAVVDCNTHLIVAAAACRGPKPDVNRFVPLLDQARKRVTPAKVLADAGYDSEPNHRHARETCGIRSFMPATYGRPSARPPTGKHRRHMRYRLNKDYGSYGQRWQVETVFSMIKRRFRAVVMARKPWSQRRELGLLVISHNVAVLLVVVFYRAGQVRFFSQ